ncbi:MAG: response regulator [Acidobacteria bacterium]|nr:response regulator [Acidobacteriota bacterium]
MSATEKRILIVDDDADLTAGLAFFLEQHGYTVLVAHDGREGLRLARMELPHLVVMDIMMNERTEGLFTIQEIRHTPELKNLPVFVLSALYEQVPDFRIAPEAGWMAHDEFFHKPVNMPRLLERIRLRIGPDVPKEVPA